MRKFLIAATNSGCGKTTITIGLLRALQRKGLRVQPLRFHKNRAALIFRAIFAIVKNNK